MKVALKDLRKVEMSELISGKVVVVEKYDRTIGVIVNCAKKPTERDFVEILFSLNLESLVNKIIRKGTYLVSLCVRDDRTGRYYNYSFDAYNHDSEFYEHTQPRQSNKPRQPRHRNVEPTPSLESDFTIGAKLSDNEIKTQTSAQPRSASQPHEDQLVTYDGKKEREGTKEAINNDPPAKPQTRGVEHGSSTDYPTFAQTTEANTTANSSEESLLQSYK